MRLVTGVPDAVINQVLVARKTLTADIADKRPDTRVKKLMCLHRGPA